MVTKTGAAHADRRAFRNTAPVASPPPPRVAATLILASIGVAVLAAVFAANGSYASRATFMHGIRFAILVAAAAALAAVIPALLAPSRAQAPASAGETRGL